MGLFKKKVENPNELLAQVLRELIKSANITIGDVLGSELKKKVGVEIPVPTVVKNVDISGIIADAIASKIKQEVALEALKSIKRILSEYKL